jgi:hypothetical protein
MRFLIHGNLDPAVDAAVVRHGHAAQRPAAAQIETDVDAHALLSSAHKKQLDVITNDRDVADLARTTPVKFDRSLIYLQLPGESVEQDDAIDRLFDRYKRLKPGQLYTVTETRVKVQQMKSAMKAE